MVERLGHRVGMLLSLGGMALGAVLLTAPERTVTLFGAVLLGTGSAVSIQVVPAALTRRHPGTSAAAIGEANAVSSAASLLAPAAVAAAIAIGIGWRTGYLLPALPVAIGLIALYVLHPQLRGWLVVRPGGRHRPGRAGASPRARLSSPVRCSRVGSTWSWR